MTGPSALAAEQNLDERGNWTARIKKYEVDDAF